MTCLEEMIGPLDRDDDVIGPLVRRGPLFITPSLERIEHLRFEFILRIFYLFEFWVSVGMFFSCKCLFFEILLVGVFW